MSNPKNYASSRDVAIKAGVSQSAVSRCFTPGACISAKTREKVQKAALELGYRPSIFPGVMLGGRSHLVAIVLGGLSNPYYAAVLQELARELALRQYKALLVPVESDYAFDSVVAQLARYRVDAVISALAILSEEAAASLSTMKVPVVAFNTNVRTDWLTSVSANNFEGGAQIAEHFLSRGAKRPAFLSGPFDSPAIQHRLEGFQSVLKGHKINHMALIESSNFSYQGGAEAALKAFSGPSHPDSVFCANDILAMGVIDTLRHSLKLRVPEDVLVAGFDGIPEAEWLAYDLTTITQPPALLAQAALDLVERRLTSQNFEREITVKGNLIARSSTRR